MPKICIVRLISSCGGYDCDPNEIIQESDWIEVTDEELKYLTNSVRDYNSPIFDHTIIVKPELDISDLKLKSKEYYDKIIEQEKKKEAIKLKKEKEKSKLDQAKALAKKKKKLEQLQMELGILPKTE